MRQGAMGLTCWPEVESHRVRYSLAEADGAIRSAFGRYEAQRKPRTSRIQANSSANTWMSGGNDDTSWLYGYANPAS
jgi:hypothetical protein